VDGVVALTELGLGFEPVSRGAKMPMSPPRFSEFPRRQQDPIIETTIDFAGLREIIDSAVETYNSGTKTRILAVGGLPFPLKCVKHTSRLLKAGRFVAAGIA